MTYDNKGIYDKEGTMSHTPGPWSIQPSSNPKNGTAWRDIVSLGQEFSPSYVGEALERDARLIAAAPEMLEALKGYNLIDYTLLIGDALILNTDPRVAEILERLSAAIQQAKTTATQAIAKAEGKE